MYVQKRVNRGEEMRSNSKLIAYEKCSPRVSDSNLIMIFMLEFSGI